MPVICWRWSPSALHTFWSSWSVCGNRSLETFLIPVYTVYLWYVWICFECIKTSGVLNLFMLEIYSRLKLHVYMVMAKSNVILRLFVKNLHVCVTFKCCQIHSAIWKSWFHFKLPWAERSDHLLSVVCLFVGLLSFQTVIIFFSRITETIPTNLSTKHPWVNWALFKLRPMPNYKWW